MWNIIALFHACKIFFHSQFYHEFSCWVHWEIRGTSFKYSIRKFLQLFLAIFLQLSHFVALCMEFGVNPEARIFSSQSALFFSSRFVVLQPRRWSVQVAARTRLQHFALRGAFFSRSHRKILHAPPQRRNIPCPLHNNPRRKSQVHDRAQKKKTSTEGRPTTKISKLNFSRKFFSSAKKLTRKKKERSDLLVSSDTPPSTSPQRDGEHTNTRT